MLAYIIAALIWWYIALTRQNEKMVELRLSHLVYNGKNNEAEKQKIYDDQKRKRAQYIGEGSIFFLLISAGAIFVYRSLISQFRIIEQQQNFMIAITHELKTPIAVTKLNLETLQKRKLDELQQQRLLGNTLQEANRMNALCNNMLLSSQIEAGGYQTANEEIDFSSIVKDCVEDFKTRYPQRIILDNIANDVFVNGDSLLLQMAINNLIDNALKYSGKEGKVTVKLTRSNRIELQVSDDGPGITDDEKGNVFRKFYRLGNEATRRSKGTGLGLYVTSKIVAAQDGQIFIIDNKPKGCIFVFKLKEAV